MVDSGAGRLVCGSTLLFVLPGVAAALLLRQRDPLETLVFGLVLSQPLVTLLVYLCTMYVRLSPWASLAAGGIALAAILALFPRHGVSPVSRTMDWPILFPLGAALLLALLTAAYYLHDPPSMLNIHGLFHTSGINQLMAGLVPPDNTHLYDHASGYQWPAWIIPAVSSMLLEVSPPLTAAVARLLIFLGLLGLGSLLARDLGQLPAGRAFSGLLAVLGMNLGGGLLYLRHLISLPDLRQALLSGAYYPGLQLLLTPEAMPEHLRIRTASLIIKLVRFNFIFHGYAAVMVAILGMVRVISGRPRSGYALILLGTAVALLVHPILALMLALPAPLSLLLATMFRRKGERFPLLRLAGVAVCLGIAALPVLPYLLPGVETAGGGGVGMRVERGITFALIWLYLPLIPAAAPAAYAAFRERDLRGIFITLLAVTFAFFLLVQQVKCDWYHLYLMSIPLGLLAGGQLGRWYHRLPGIGWRTVAGTAVAVLILLGPLLRLHAFTQSRRPDAGRYRFAQARLIVLEDRRSDLALAYHWIRQQTPPETVLVEKPKQRNLEELSALTGRRVLVGLPTPHTPGPGRGRDPMGEALALAHGLLLPGSDKREHLDQLAGLPDPVCIVLYRGDAGAGFPLLVAEYASLPDRVRLELDLPTVKIYRVMS